MVEQLCRSEAERRLIQLASEYGKSLVSSQTGYLHYYGQHSEFHHTIPVLDNILLSLIWMKTKAAEQVQAGKALLASLLPLFREGNFPAFFHEYPECKDRFLGYKALLPLAIIYHQFGPYLGNELRKTLYEILQNLSKDCNDLPNILRLKQQCAQVLLGEHKTLSELNWQELTIECCTEAALAYYAIQPKLPPALLQRLVKDWDSVRQCQSSVKIRQYGFLPQITVYELLMYYLQGTVPARPDLPTMHVLLQAALLPEKCEDVLPVNSQTSYSLKTASKTHAEPLHEDYRLHTLYALWGSANFPSTFVCQVASNVVCDVSERADGADLVYTFKEPFSGSDDDFAKEISFYLSLPKDQKISFSLEDGIANTFQQNETLTVMSNGMQIQLRFEVEGLGQFVGHVLPGNRPAQCADKGAQRFAVFDRQILLRTVSRSQESQMKVSIYLKKQPTVD